MQQESGVAGKCETVHVPKSGIWFSCSIRRYKYPPDKAEYAVELVLKQAEVLSMHWLD